jgi:HK97 family phage major capsid protein
MKSSKQLQSEIETLQAKVQAINTVAQGENRELLADEQAEIDAIVGDDKNPGQIANLAKERERALKIEALVSNAGRQVRDAQDESVENASRSFKIPARAKATRALKAFRGSDAEMDAYRSGQWILATQFKQPKAMQWCADHGVQNAMSGSNDLTGGTLVIPEFETAVISLFESYGVIPQLARNYPMASDVLTIPRQLSDVTAYAVGESQEITASDPTFSPVNLVARKWATLTRVPSELNDDAVIAMADMLATSIARAHALKADQSGFLGDGSTTYHGVTGLANGLNAGSVVTAAATQITSALLTIAVFQNAVGKLPEYPGINPVWICHKAVYWNVLARLQLAAGGNNYADLGNGPVLQFMGYPVVFSQVLPSTIAASTKFAYFGDLGMASTLGLRRGLSISSDASRYFELDQIAYRSTMRWDFNIHEKGDANNAGPVIRLETPAA